jgi:hypothetical protein
MLQRCFTSSGVADRSGEMEKGMFHTFITNETMPIFDYVIQIGEANSLVDAVAVLADKAGVELQKGDLRNEKMN